MYKEPVVLKIDNKPGELCQSCQPLWRQTRTHCRTRRPISQCLLRPRTQKEKRSKWLMGKQTLCTLGCGCGSVGRAITSDTRGPQFKSSFRQFLKEYLYAVNCWYPRQHPDIKPETINSRIKKCSHKELFSRRRWATGSNMYEKLQHVVQHNFFGFVTNAIADYLSLNLLN